MFVVETKATQMKNNVKYYHKKKGNTILFIILMQYIFVILSIILGRIKFNKLLRLIKLNIFFLKNIKVTLLTLNDIFMSLRFPNSTLIGKLF